MSCSHSITFTRYVTIAETLNGQLPYLEIENTTIIQSGAIAMYLAKELGWYQLLHCYVMVYILLELCVMIYYTLLEWCVMVYTLLEWCVLVYTIIGYALLTANNRKFLFFGFSIDL